MADDRIDGIIALMVDKLAEAVNEAGFMFEREAKARARVRTGYMRNSIRWIPDDENRLEGEVVGGAAYTVYNEYGTIYMSAQPMFWPAAEVVQPRFDELVRAAVQDAVNEG